MVKLSKLARTAAATGLTAGSLMAFMALPASAANDKGTMYDSPTGSCSQGATGGTAEGFANLNDQNGSVNGVVSLKGAKPNATYNVTLNAADGTCSTVATIGTLTTNGQGNGNVSIPKTAVTGPVFVEAFDFTSFDFLASPAQN